MVGRRLLDLTERTDLPPNQCRASSWGRPPLAQCPRWRPARPRGQQVHMSASCPGELLPQQAEQLKR